MEARVLREIDAGIDVYYDREWPLTSRFCEYLLAHPEILAGRKVFVAGAGVGPEAVVAGVQATRLWINDRSPAALELLSLQLHENGIRDFEPAPGSFGEIPLPPDADMVVASFAIYDSETAEAANRLLSRARARRVPVILANQEIGPHFAGVMERAAGRVRELHRDEQLRVVRVDPERAPG